MILNIYYVITSVYTFFLLEYFVDIKNWIKINFTLKWMEINLIQFQYHFIEINSDHPRANLFKSSCDNEGRSWLVIYFTQLRIVPFHGLHVTANQFSQCAQYSRPTPIIRQIYLHTHSIQDLYLDTHFHWWNTVHDQLMVTSFPCQVHGDKEHLSRIKIGWRYCVFLPILRRHTISR